jgi:hypothetical protein
MAKPYRIRKTETGTTGGAVYTWWCRDNPDIWGETDSKEVAIAQAEAACGDRYDIDNPIANIAPISSVNPSFNSCASCSRKISLKSSKSDFQFLSP